MTVRKLIFACLAGLVAALATGETARADVEQDAIGSRQAAMKKAYQRSIFESAVKRPDYRKRLVPIDARKRRVTVISLTRKADPPDEPDNPFPQDKGYLQLEPQPGGNGTLIRNTWISLPDELAPKCRGAADPLLKLQMLLGMPPEGGKWELVRFDVATKHMFRPCASGPSITSRRCSFDIPDGGSKADLETQQFVFQQMWSSYTKGFRWPGYPFTGMGWTYNWDPDARNPYGISEYVVRQGSPISGIETLSPKTFCAAS